MSLAILGYQGKEYTKLGSWPTIDSGHLTHLTEQEAGPHQVSLPGVHAAFTGP